MALPARLQSIAQYISVVFNTPEDVAAAVVRKHRQGLVDMMEPQGAPALCIALAPHVPLDQERPHVTSANDLQVVAPQALEPRGVFAFLLRAVPAGKAIDLEKCSDGALTMGQIAGDPLAGLAVDASTVFGSMLRAKQEWGKLPASDAHSFVQHLAEFAESVEDAATAADRVVKIKVPTRDEIPAGMLSRLSLSGSRRQRVTPQQVSQYMSLIQGWCKVLEKELGLPDLHGVPALAGPRALISWWHQRVFRLSSVAEQLRHPACTDLVAVMAGVARGMGGDELASAPVLATMRRWKELDMHLTEAIAEAKDNAKYLATLQPFLEPLYGQDPHQLVDGLPALLNSINMVHCVARYFGTPARMSDLLAHTAGQVITACKHYILDLEREDTQDKMFKKTPAKLVERINDVLAVTDAWQHVYAVTAEQTEVSSVPGKAWSLLDWDAVHGNVELFGRRMTKLFSMFSTIADFDAMFQYNVEGIEGVVRQYQRIATEMASKRHDLFAYRGYAFDRDFVEFTVRINEMEELLLQFIQEQFASIMVISKSLQLLRKFQRVFQRPALQADLRQRQEVIFQAFGAELEHVQALYEEQKHAPPRARDMPPVAGNIMWARHLFQRIEAPMQYFSQLVPLLETKIGKRIVKLYNRIARTLVAYEFLWFRAWADGVDKATACLQATLVIRHPVDGQLYVNFDQEILQIIRESKCLQRMGIDVPEAARAVVVQEARFKQYHAQLTQLLTRFEQVKHKVFHATWALLSPALQDLEMRLRPGMVALTWTSMSIEAYRVHVHAGLDKLEALVHSVNDILENRVERSMRQVARTKLVDLPSNESVTLQQFVRMQHAHIQQKAAQLQSANQSVEQAVQDFLRLVLDYEVDPNVNAVDQEEVSIIKQHYNNYFYAALLACTKNSLNALKERLTHHVESAALFTDRPFFEVDVQLIGHKVSLSPSLSQVQNAINQASRAILRCSQRLYDWDQQHVPEAQRVTFFQRITRDIEIVRVVLLLTGSIQGTRHQVQNYLSTFHRFSWLWDKDAEEEYAKFAAGDPSIDDYDRRLSEFQLVQDSIGSVSILYNIGALSLATRSICDQLRAEVQAWQHKFSDKLHKKARRALADQTEYMKTTLSMLDREVDSLTSLRYVMDVLHEVRHRQASIDMILTPILDEYRLLENFGVALTQEELDTRSVLRASWKRVVDRASEVTDAIAEVQGTFRKTLLVDLKVFVQDVAEFRQDYLQHGPMVEGTGPVEAMDRLRRYEDKFEIMDRKAQLYNSGEDLFAMQATPFPELEETRKELALLAKLYSLYRDVMGKMDEYRTILWADVVASIDTMTADMEGFSSRCKKMPKRLRGWRAYLDLKQEIEDFQLVLPLLQELSKASIRPRHWNELEQILGCPDALRVDEPEFKLADLMAQPLVDHFEAIQEITISADKQLDLEVKIAEITERWDVAELQFAEYKTRAGVMVMSGVPLVVEELEEAQMNLQTFLTSRHVSPFRESTQELLQRLSDTSETLELWLKVQLQWSSLEVVFLGGDIAKQMPAVAKKFQKLDKDFVNIMNTAAKALVVVACCQNEVLKSSLPAMYDQLETCQKHLDGYLEQKRNKFPRFFFCSGPVLLQILSKGSDPQAIQDYYPNVFDSIDRVEHDKKDKTLIVGIMSFMRGAKEYVELQKPVKCAGNIEEWLMELLREQQRSMKYYCAECAAEIAAVGDRMDALRTFVDAQCGQYALLGLQLMWTADTQAALEAGRGKKGAVDAARKKAMDVQRTLAGWCLQDLGSKMNRTKIETLVTIQVHQADVSRELAALWKARRLRSAESFDWLKQARFYWDADAEDFLNDEGRCSIAVTDVTFEYQYEYLGCKERLVITPLTDRCYITLAQALGLNMGGAPAGPAGTGKTETVKDMGRTLGIMVVVTNCSDQMRYTDCAKIFKGLCQAGLWGCFDEFNRIALPVLSVVAQQVLSINNAKKANAQTFYFPGDDEKVTLNPVCGFFITMNPGYAGRQELPENLKALFRGVAMMVPDREIIMKVKLVSVGYENADALSKKFFICYKLCEEQLSKQRHYDFGLRNILSVLRTAGATKRENLGADEEVLLYRTLRDMNLSKLVAQDVPLFLSMLADLFPQLESPPKGEFPKLTQCLEATTAEAGLIMHPDWVTKVVQLHETTLVRHGIMLSGPSGGGKSRIFEQLQAARGKWEDAQYRIARLNPKAILAHELYGSYDPLSGEWIKGVFSALWEKYNKASLPYITWIVEDGPVDAIWIEDMNTVLDDNKILTLSNGDRFPMTDNVKIMFENETLHNASPATVSRCGIVYVSDTDLDWAPVLQAWIQRQAADLQEPLSAIIGGILGLCNPVDPGQVVNFLTRQCSPIMMPSRVGLINSMYTLLDAMLARSCAVLGDLSSPEAPGYRLLTRMVLFAVMWSFGGLLEFDDRVKFDGFLRTLVPEGAMPEAAAGSTLYEFALDEATLQWTAWKPPMWTYPNDSAGLDFSNLLVPTMDSTRAVHLLGALHGQQKPVLMTGGPGTAKTSTALMFFAGFDAAKRLLKRLNFSSATTMRMFQDSIEAELDKRGGKSYGPPGGKKMTVFIDDISMPEINEWGDQPTNEIVRQIIEQGGLYFLDKDKRGDFKACEDLEWVGAMTHPGGGRNDIPNRLKRQFFMFNLVLPAIQSIDDLYGQMLHGRFKQDEFSPACLAVVNKLTTATIALWNSVKSKMLPTPAKFHYVFNMRELSRVFQGVLLTPKATIQTGGQQTARNEQDVTLLRIWKHECERVFADKLVLNEEKLWYSKKADDIVETHFGARLAEHTAEEALMCNFFREDIYDDDDVLVELAPKIYEEGGELDAIRDRVTLFMAKHNDEFPSRPLNLVVFEDALRHMLRISRILAMPRGSALLVGVGGSGKQSLTRLSAYVARSQLFQITLTKTYGVNALMEDIKQLFDMAGHERKSVTFLFTDAEIKQEAFLEYINSILMTGDVAGLFAKDEMMGITADLQPHFAKLRPHLPETLDNLKQFFIDCVRDNLHVVLCMSPVNPKFPERARKFPGLISGCTIDWFLPWPEEALVSVSRGLLGNFAMDATPEVRSNLITHMGMVHNMVVKVCDEYFSALRRHVYQTPKSFLAFIANFKEQYAVKVKELEHKERNVNMGLEKLIQGAKDVDVMKGVLRQEQHKVEEATQGVNELIAVLNVKKAEAEAQSEKVAGIKAACEADKNQIAEEAALCQADLDKAQPIVDKAIAAAESITPKDVNDIKSFKPAPPAAIRLVLDQVAILFQAPILPVTNGDDARNVVGGVELDFLADSYKFSGAAVLAATDFLDRLQNFARDDVNEETCELVEVYAEHPFVNSDFLAEKRMSSSAVSMAIWAGAMREYFFASRIVKPKLEALALAQAKLNEALKKLGQAEREEQEVLDRLAGLQAQFDGQMAEKNKLEEGAAALSRKLEQAEALINGLAGERVRWTNDSKTFADMKQRLVGDCAVACAFVCYCGPFNAQFRSYLVNDKFSADLKQRRVPVTPDLDVIDFLVDLGTIGDWNLDGLPTDPLSIQNGILVTRSSRYPLLVDPQGQALTWIRNKEHAALPSPPVTALNNPRLKDNLEFCMQEGKAFIVVGVEEELDPLLDPVLEKEVVVRNKRQYIKVADSEVELDPAFSMYFITRLPNPHFSPELQAKTTVVDFTVTMKGLEDQLLGLVIKKEKKELEDMLDAVLAEVNANRKALMELDAQLLDRLSSNTGNLLDDEELVGVLGNTKAKAREVKEKLDAADETKQNISEQRETYRPVATRGSVLYFSVVDMSKVNVMYQTSLAQFVELFLRSIDDAEKSALATKRVGSIIECMTYQVYRYVNMGLYEQDKLLLLLIVTTKILITAELLDASEVALFMRGGAALDISAVKPGPRWLDDESWLNVLALSDVVPFFKSLPDALTRNEGQWRAWFESNDPEQLAVPDFDEPLRDDRDTGPWKRLLVLRAMRKDRTLLALRQFVRNSREMGPRYTEPVTDTIEDIYEAMVADVPVIFLLSVGADPTDAIEGMAKRCKTSVDVVSMGEGQEPVAKRALEKAAVNGTWVLLQNVELGLELMHEMEDLLHKMRDACHEDFRLFLTALPHKDFPLGLLQMSTKVTNEPPAGLKAGLHRSFTVEVDQDRLERIDVPSQAGMWRRLLFNLCFLHSLVQERRKFGPLGWCVPYEYNSGDLRACILFLEKHLYAGPISWPTFQYMVAEAQYGGKITDDLDRRLFNTYASWLVCPAVLEPDFTYNPAQPIAPIPANFTYLCMDELEIDAYRQYASSFPEIDSPEIFGLHPNADLTFRVKEVNALLATLGETQPKATSGGSGRSLDDMVVDKCDELLEKMPEDYVEEDYVRKIRKLGGLSKPLNVFLYQEIQRFQRVVSRARHTLRQIKLAVNGEVVMTTELVDAMQDIFAATAPKPWLYTPGGDEFSWLLPNLGQWFSSLLERDAQLRSWLEHKPPDSFWMTGFSNPQGFLTAMQQEVTRLHKREGWALDNVTYHTEVTDMLTGDAVREPPEEGVYVHGLWLDGARWSRKAGSLVESEPKKLFAALPVLWITTMRQSLLGSKRDVYSPTGIAPYLAPVYRYPTRTDRYLVVSIPLPTKSDRPEHWTLRGAAVLCITQQ